MQHHRTIGQRVFAMAILFSGIWSLNSCTKSGVAPSPLAPLEEERTAGDPGFTEAYFSESVLFSLMSHPDFQAFAFYNARRNAADAAGTVLTIGVRADGTEIQNSTTLKYRLYDQLQSSGILTRNCTRAEAKTRIDELKSDGATSYAGDVTKSIIETMLNAPNCNGIRLIPEWLPGSGQWSFRIHPVRILNGSATVLSSPASFLLAAPCPTFCGRGAANYIHL